MAILGELDDEQKRAVQDALKRIPQIEAAISKAKLAGIDVSALESDLATAKRQLQGIHDVYVVPKRP